MNANEGWNYLFFGRKDLRASVVGMLSFVGLTLALYRTLKQVDNRSATIMLSYLGRVASAYCDVGTWQWNRVKTRRKSFSKRVGFYALPAGK